MLAKHPIDVMLLATDLGVAKEFYGDKIGLEVLIETDDFLTFRCGGDSRLVVTRAPPAPSEEQTKASWRVTTSPRRWPSCAREASRSTSTTSPV